MKKITFYLVLLITILALSNCSKTEVVESDQNSLKPEYPDVEIMNGLINVSSNETMIELMNFIAKSKREVLARWEKSIGFVSYRHLADEAYAIASQAKSIDELERLVEKYKKYLQINESGGEKELAYTNPDKLFSSLSDENGYFITGKMVNRVLGNYILTTEIGNTDLLSYYDNANISELKIADVKVQQIKIFPALKTYCGTTFGDVKTVDNYRVVMEGYYHTYVLYWDPYMYTTCIDGLQKTKGQKKTIFWFNNKSNLVQGGDGTLMYNLNGAGDVSVQGEFPYWYENDVIDIETRDRWATLDSNLSSFSAYFSQIDAWSSSSNVPINAEVDCGN